MTTVSDFSEHIKSNGIGKGKFSDWLFAHIFHPLDNFQPMNSALNCLSSGICLNQRLSASAKLFREKELTWKRNGKNKKHVSHKKVYKNNVSARKDCPL